MASITSFNVLETTIDDIHAAYKSGQLTCRRLIQMYLERIEMFDKKGPNINALITINAEALKEADRLDAAYKASGPVGPLHGIPVIVKDQADVKGMPTTLGSLLFKDYFPDRDSFVAEKVRKAGAIILGKATLGELGGGDTHGSLFGSTRNPYDIDRTVGGSSGGSAASVSANFSTVAIGQEGLASIRRPSTWNCIAGMRPSAGLVSRGGVYGCWPEIFGSLGPMARTVKDLSTLLDAMVGYDPEDPITARGVGHTPDTFANFLHKDGLKDPMGQPFIDEAVVERSRNALIKAGLKLVTHDVVIATKQEAIAAMGRMKNDEEVDAVILFSGTWVWAAHLVGAIRDYAASGKGLMLWTHPGSQGWRPVGGLVMHGGLLEIGVAHKFVYGASDDPEAIGKITSYAQAAHLLLVIEAVAAALLAYWVQKTLLFPEMQRRDAHTHLFGRLTHSNPLRMGGARPRGGPSG